MSLEVIQKQVKHKLSMNAELCDKNIEIRNINIEDYDGLNIQYGERMLIVLYNKDNDEYNITLYKYFMVDCFNLEEYEEIVENSYVASCSTIMVSTSVKTIMTFLMCDYSEFNINEN